MTAVPANKTFPAGGTWFDTLRKSFVDVPVDTSNDNAIPTTEFLEAAESLATLFTVIGSLLGVVPRTAFQQPQADIISNIKKVRDRQLVSPGTSETLQSLVINEIKAKPKAKDDKSTGVQGLIWLVHGMDFTAQALRLNLDNPSQELKESFQNAYANSPLQKAQKTVWGGTGIVWATQRALSYTPAKKDLYKKLGDNESKVDEALKPWLQDLEKQVSILKQFQARKEARW